MGYGLIAVIAESFIVTTFDEVDRVVGHPTIRQRFRDDIVFAFAATMLRLAIDVYDVVRGGRERVAAVLR
jgi:hypothetical protein